MPRKKIKLKVESDNKCDLCTGSLCCVYVTQAIDTPRSKADFNHLLWQVSHENVEAYKDEDGWSLLFNTPCSHLEVDGRCGIYDKRPPICSEYSNDYCEYDAPPENGWDLHFTNHKQLYKYLKKRFKRWP